MINWLLHGGNVGILKHNQPMEWITTREQIRAAMAKETPSDEPARVHKYAEYYTRMKELESQLEDYRKAMEEIDGIIRFAKKDAQIELIKSAIQNAMKSSL